MPAISDFSQDVYACTDREDLTKETLVALRRALRHCHYNSEYNFDVQIQSVPSSGTVENPIMLPARYRATVYLGTDSESNPLVLKEITPQAYFRPDVQMDKSNVYWVIGSTLNIRAQTPYTFLNHYYLQVPDFSDSAIAINHREYIVFKAAEYVLTMIDQAAKAQRFAAYAEEIAVELQRSVFLR